jgi:hypothetical protein
MIEQTFSAWLLGIAFMANNPFYVFHLISPSIIYLLIDAIAIPLFQAAVFATILLNLDLLQFGSSNLFSAGLPPKLGFAGIVWLFGAAGQFHELIKQFRIPDLRPDRLGRCLMWMRIGLSLVFCICTFYLIARDALYIEVEDFYKFAIHLYSGLLVIGAVIVSASMDIAIDTADGMEGSRAVCFSFFNVFTLLEAFLHWPHEPQTRRIYPALAKLKRPKRGGIRISMPRGPPELLLGADESVSEFGLDAEEPLDL